MVDFIGNYALYFQLSSWACVIVVPAVSPSQECNRAEEIRRDGRDSLPGAFWVLFNSLVTTWGSHGAHTYLYEKKKERVNFSKAMNFSACVPPRNANNTLKDLRGACHKTNFTARRFGQRKNTGHNVNHAPSLMHTPCRVTIEIANSSCGHLEALQMRAYLGDRHVDRAECEAAWQ